LAASAHTGAIEQLLDDARLKPDSAIGQNFDRVEANQYWPPMNADERR
jgi:hypothetical protein